MHSIRILLRFESKPVVHLYQFGRSRLLRINSCHNIVEVKIIMKDVDMGTSVALVYVTIVFSITLSFALLLALFLSFSFRDGCIAFLLTNVISHSA